MKTIYDWLLLNMGNEGNYLTILNVQRHTNGEQTTGLDVMARTKEFCIINLLMMQVPLANQSNGLAGRRPKESHLFANANQVIAYLAKGEPAAESAPLAIQVDVLEPAGNAESASFPPK